MSKPPKQPDKSNDESASSMDAGPADDADYEIGYGKPPKEHQFKPGNEHGKGRPKGAKSTKTIVNEALGAKVSPKSGGPKMTKFEFGMHQLATMAAKGDLKAIDKVIQLQERYGPQEDPEGPPKEKLSKDLSSLEKYLAMKNYIGSDDEEEGDE